MNMRKISLALSLMVVTLSFVSTHALLEKTDRNARRVRLQQLTEELQRLMTINPVEHDATQFIRTPAENKQLGAQLQQVAKELRDEGFSLNTQQIEKKIADFNELPGTASAIARSYMEQTESWKAAYAQKMEEIKKLEKLLQQYETTVREVKNELTHAQTMKQSFWKK